MEFSVVFRLNSVEELDELAKALKGTVTLQAKIRLENELKRMEIEKNAFIESIRKLKSERDNLRGDKRASTDKEEAPSPMSETVEETTVAEARPSSFEPEIERVLENINTLSPTEESEEPR